MNKENIIHDREKFKEIMNSLNGSIISAFIRVSNRNNAGILDSDLINMRLSDKPITISVRENGDIVISDNGENLYSVNMRAFDYADISDMDKENTFGFLKTPCHTIIIWLQTNVFIALYYWTKEDK